jgi:hypothetical protein
MMDEKNQKDIKNESIIVFTYNNFYRFIFIFWLLLMFVLGLLFILTNKLFAIIFGILIVIFVFFSILDILLFKRLVIYQHYITKEWYVFGIKKINFSEIKVTLVLRIWTGQLIFSGKKITDRFVMNLELFPVVDFKNKLNKLKSILIEKNIIKGDENEWNY